MQLKDLTGKRFGKLTVLRRADSRLRKDNGRGRTFWECVCDCGVTKEINADNLSSGRSSTCGCGILDAVRIRSTTHGATTGYKRTSEYRAWCHARGRCLCPTDPKFPEYGARGIKFCERWMDFAVFISDMGPRPAGMTLERKDVNGDYEPANCIWATWLDQANNKQNTIWTVIGGVRMSLRNAARKEGVNYKRLHLLHRKQGVPINMAIASLKSYVS